MLHQITTDMAAPPLSYRGLLLCLFLAILNAPCAQDLIPVAKGWANNSINTVVFRKNSLVSFGSNQYIAFYDSGQNVVVGKRDIDGRKWTLHKTRFKGNASDAHRSISIMVDGAGYIHLAWDHHNNPLNYAKSIAPGSLTFGPKQMMTGKIEKELSYPEFYRLPGGDLLFFYRNGMSGAGNLIIDRYSLKTGHWTQVQSDLIDGQGKRNAYWQACIDENGSIHLSWVWRETPDVASNHDLAYARSDDGGLTWKKSDGTPYHLPITAASAEYACHIAQNSELINQTSMTTDRSGRPYIATYLRDSVSGNIQYHIVFLKGRKWHVKQLGFLTKGFSLNGTGTKQIPISRPQIFAWQEAGTAAVHIGLLFRAAEMGNKVAVAYKTDLYSESASWKVKTLGCQNVDSWEPSLDTELWKSRGRMDVFVEKTPQADQEGTTVTPPQMVSVLSFNPRQLLK